MAYDGLTVAATVKEFCDHLIGGRIAKITQPERDEIVLTVRNQKDNYKVQISVNPSLPLCVETKENKPAPLTAPSFCMALRKHIGNGAIVNVHQPDSGLQTHGLERVVIFEIEHLDEMGDLGTRYLSVELMGKYSNIILLRDDYTVIDSIRRISASQSSVREVLPNRPYFIPDAGNKKNPLQIEKDTFCDLIGAVAEPVFKALFHHLTGLSPVIASEICFRAGVDADLAANCLSMEQLEKVYHVLRDIVDQVAVERRPEPNILYSHGKPMEFSAVHLSSYEHATDIQVEHLDSMAEAIHVFYSAKDKASRIHQKSTDLRKVLNTLLERTSKKLMLQEKQLKSTEGKDKFRIYGELLHTYGYSLAGGENRLVCENYYTNEEIEIPLDKDLTASENAKRYMERYDKLKRTEQNVTIQLAETRRELEHLNSICAAMDIAEGEEDLQDLRREMQDFGFIHKAGNGKDKGKGQRKSKPYHYVSSDGFEIFVGKNNYQNEEVTFKIADGGDLWFHAKNVPGSHVIVKTGGRNMEELPDRLFIEAAELAAFYSSHKEDAKVEIDYTIRKNLKKVPNAAPGFVIYHTNWSVTVEPKNDLKPL